MNSAKDFGFAFRDIQPLRAKHRDQRISQSADAHVAREARGDAGCVRGLLPAETRAASPADRAIDDAERLPLGIVTGRFALFRPFPDQMPEVFAETVLAFLAREYPAR